MTAQRENLIQIATIVVIAMAVAGIIALQNSNILGY